jgi:outer membrane receptor for ferrienterochelin and colicins
LKLLLFFLFFLTGSLFGQTESKVFSSDTKEAMYATSILIYKEGKVINMIRTNSDGSFSIPDDFNFEEIEIRRLGYEKLMYKKNEIPTQIYIKPVPNAIEEIVVTGQILPGNKYQSPFKLKYYSKEEIQNKKVHNLAEFLQTENNFTITQDPILGTRVSLNGLSGQDLNLLIDGVPVAGKLNGTVDFSQILLNNIERVEVVDGPLSVIYGTNASGGVINLITQTKVKDASTLDANIYGESVGVLNFNTQFGFNHEGNNVTFGFGRNVFLGWDPNEDELRQKIKPIWRDYSWNPKEQYFANLSFYRRINSQSNIHVKFNAFWESILNKLNPSSTFSRIVFDENYSNQRYVLGLTHTQKIDKSLELVSNLNGTIFQRTVKNFSQNLTNSYREILRQEIEKQYNLFGRAILRQDPKQSKVKMLYGIDFKYDAINTPKIESQSQDMFEIGIFSMINLKVTEKLFFQPGLRFGFHSRFLSPISPTANFRFEPNEIISTRFSYSRGYRNPEIKEMFFEFIDNNHNIKGNSNLKTEINDNFQFGFDIKPKFKPYSNHSYSTSFTFSYINKDNAIEIVPVDISKNEFKYFNIGTSNSLVFSLDNRMKYKDFIFSLGANVLGNQKIYLGVKEQIRDFFYNFSLNLNTTYTIAKYDIKLSLLNKFNSPNTFTLLNILENKASTSTIPSFMMSDFNVSKSFIQNKYTLTLGVKNIFNIENLTLSGFNNNFHSGNDNNQTNFLWGRTFFASFNINLKE